MSLTTRRLNAAGRALTATLAAPLVFTLTLAPPAGGPGAMADVIHLVGGNKITATIIEVHDDRIVVQHEALGRLEISRERIVSIESEPPAEGEAEAPPAEPPPPPPDEPAPKWKSSFTLGASGSFGNSDTQNVTIGLSSVYDQGLEITKIDLNYYLDMSNGDRTDNRFNANVRHDWLMPDSPWLYFAQARYDYDRFQSWEHRFSAHGGFGYRLVDTPEHRLSVRAGAGFSKEWKSPEQEFRPEILGGLDWDWTISEKQSIHVDTTIFPDLDNTGEFRTLTNANWSALLDEETAMSLTAGVFHEYQSDVPSDTDKNDVKIFVGLKFEF